MQLPLRGRRRAGNAKGVVLNILAFVFVVCIIGEVWYLLRTQEAFNPTSRDNAQQDHTSDLPPEVVGEAFQGANPATRLDAREVDGGSAGVGNSVMSAEDQLKSDLQERLMQKLSEGGGGVGGPGAGGVGGGGGGELVVGGQQQQEEEEEEGGYCAADNTPPVIAMFHGKPEGEKMEWNTGVWCAWGKQKNDVVTLQWAANGVEVVKTCDVECVFTQDKKKFADADVILFEIINHPKFYGKARAKNLPIPWPVKKPGSYWGLFYWEPMSWWTDWTKDPEIRSHWDFEITPEQSSDLPVTSVCPWGHDRGDFYLPPPPKEDDHFIAYYLHGHADPYKNFIRTFMRELGPDLHNYKKLGGNKEMPFEEKPYSLPKRMDFIGSYKFVFITESVSLDDWVCGDVSQALMAGTVPVYIGAPNIADYVPSMSALVDVREFMDGTKGSTPADLIAYLRRVAADDAEYAKFFEWKNQPINPSFLNKLDQCVHYSECRLCKMVRKKMGKSC